MKRRLFTFVLAALTIGLLGSCSEINERIDGLDKRVYDLENGKIASIDQQIDAINRSIADLETIRTNIQNLMNEQEAQGQDITDLKAADITLEGKINDLKTYVDTELSKYATKDWANATFATLEQHQWTCDTIAKIDARIGALDVKLSQSISGLESSLKQWVNEQLDAYYTAAQMDAKLGVMQSEIDALKNSKDSERIDSLATELTKTKAAVDTAKANIRTEYKNAIDVAINKLDGEIRGALLDSIAAVNGRIEALDTRVTTLEGKVLTLEGNVNKLLAMVQSVTIVPAYSDGSVESTKDGVLHLDIIVTPAQAVAAITKDCLKVMVNEVKTKAVDLDTVAVTKFKADAAKGTITARADISSNLPVASGKALTAAVNVKNGISDYTTEFYPVEVSAESNVTVTAAQAGTDSTKVTIKADADFPESVMGNIVVADGFKSTKPTSITIEGIGTVTFDITATAKIKSNATSANATNVLFKVEDVTTTKPVPNADVVLEVTMKTVDETGTEVFSKEKAAGEVTIQIPVDENVVYVNRVTLVNDAGDPIEGGVVLGSEEVENGILTFKVNHFSKYAVDFVKTGEAQSVTGVSIDKSSITLEIEDIETLTATVAPDNATDKNVSWSSSDESVATVDASGKVTAVAAGTATITVTTTDGGKTTTCAVTVIPAGALAGEFSVSATKKVHFSKGNLQATYNGSSYTWSFAASQYAYVGNAAGNTTIGSQTSGAVVDLFGWSTASTTYGISTSDSSGDYSGDFVDWGKAYCEKNNITPDNTWRTLSKDEWTYLFNTSGRMVNSKPCYSNAVNGVTIGGTTYKGVFIYPDNYNGDEVSSSMTWDQINAAGIVFLPAAGYREDSTVKIVGSGYYWSSTADDDDNAYSVDFDSDDVSPDSGDARSSGSSVRLVTEVPAAGDPGNGTEQYNNNSNPDWFSE